MTDTAPEFKATKSLIKKAQSFLAKEQVVKSIDLVVPTGGDFIEGSARCRVIFLDLHTGKTSCFYMKLYGLNPFK